MSDHETRIGNTTHRIAEDGVTSSHADVLVCTKHGSEFGPATPHTHCPECVTEGEAAWGGAENYNVRRLLDIPDA